MKKWKTVTAVCVIALAVLAVAAKINGISYKGGYIYRVLDDGGVELVKYLKNSTEIDIPVELGGRDVTVIGTNCFSGLRTKSQAKVNVPDTVTTIGEKAFADCQGLTITGCRNLEEIQSYAFYCTKFTTEDSFPECGNLKVIGTGAFQMSTNLGRFMLPDTVEYVSGEAFDDRNCIVDENGEGLSGKYVSGGFVFVGDSVLYDFKVQDTVIVPYGTKTIAAELTLGSGDCLKIYLPDTVTAIGSGLLSCDNYGYVEIYIPSSVTNIGGGGDPDKAGDITYNKRISFVVESGSYAESYAIAKGIGYDAADSVTELYNHQVTERNTSLADAGYTVIFDESSQEGDTMYRVLSGTGKDGVGYEKLVSINTVTKEKNEICKVSLDCNSTETLSRIIGYKDGTVYYIGSNHVIYSSNVGDSEKNDITTFYRMDGVVFTCGKDGITVDYNVGESNDKTGSFTIPFGDATE